MPWARQAPKVELKESGLLGRATIVASRGTRAGNVGFHPIRREQEKQEAPREELQHGPAQRRELERVVRQQREPGEAGTTGKERAKEPEE